MTRYIIPIITSIILIYGIYKRVDIFDTFIEGVKEGLNVIYNLFPTIFAMTISINIFLGSNIINDIIKYISVGSFPREVIPLAIMKPISGSSSLALLSSIFNKYGPDSFIGRLSSVIEASSDTTIYIISLYLGSINIKKSKYTIILGLLISIMSVIISFIVVSYL